MLIYNLYEYKLYIMQTYILSKSFDTEIILNS